MPRKKITQIEKLLGQLGLLLFRTGIVENVSVVRLENWRIGENEIIGCK